MSRRLLILVLVFCILLTGCKSGPFATSSSPFPWQRRSTEDQLADAALGTAVLVGAGVLIAALIVGYLYLESLDDDDGVGGAPSITEQMAGEGAARSR